MQNCQFQAWVSSGGGASTQGRGVGNKDTASREGEQLHSGGQQERRAKDKLYLHFPSWSQQPWARLQRLLQSSPTRQETSGVTLSRDHR